MDQLPKNNWIQPITSDIDSQLQTPFLLYKPKDKTKIFGIWFGESEKCKLIFTLINELVEKMTQEDQDKFKHKIINQVRGVLMPEKHGMLLSKLNFEYKSLIGENIPWDKMGYRTLYEFVHQNRQLFRVEFREEGSWVHAVATEETQHIKDMVSQQKSKRTKANCKLAKGPSVVVKYRSFMEKQPAKKKKIKNKSSLKPNSRAHPCNEVKYKNKNEFKTKSALKSHINTSHFLQKEGYCDVQDDEQSLKTSECIKSIHQYMLSINENIHHSSDKQQSIQENWPNNHKTKRKNRKSWTECKNKSFLKSYSYPYHFGETGCKNKGFKTEAAFLTI